LLSQVLMRRVFKRTGVMIESVKNYILRYLNCYTSLILVGTDTIVTAVTTIGIAILTNCCFPQQGRTQNG